MGAVKSWAQISQPSKCSEGPFPIRPRTNLRPSARSSPTNPCTAAPSLKGQSLQVRLRGEWSTFWPTQSCGSRMGSGALFFRGGRALLCLPHPEATIAPGGMCSCGGRCNFLGAPAVNHKNNTLLMKWQLIAAVPCAVRGRLLVAFATQRGEGEGMVFVQYLCYI